jgi:hypothetical protein
MERFELSTPCSRSRCATRLRYIPIFAAMRSPGKDYDPYSSDAWVRLLVR